MRATIDVDPIKLEELTRLFGRTSIHSALLVGDEVSNPPGRMSGFAYVPPSQQTEPDEAHDLALLVNGSEAVEVAFSTAAASRTTQPGHRPPCSLIHGSSCRAKGNEIPKDFDLFLVHCTSKFGLDIRNLLECISKIGYDMWLVGGAVRDLTAGLKGPEGVNDIDLAGTIPFRLLYSRFLKKFVGQHQLRASVSLNGIFHCFITIKGRQEKWFEYAALKQTRCLDEQRRGEKLWFGCSLDEDSRWRDLSINALLYDPTTNTIFDATGTGIEDLRCRRLMPIIPIDWPGQRVKVLVRTLRFGYEYNSRGFRLEEAARFLNAHFTECCAEFLSLKLIEKRNLIKGFYHSKIDELKADLYLGRLNVAGRLFSLTSHPNWQKFMEAAIDAVRP